MPIKPPSANGTRQQHRRQHDHRRDREQPWRAWYKTARWQATAKHQLTMEPLCAICFAAGRVTPATVCDHIEPHRGDPVKFWNGPFQSLCDQAPWRCHSSVKQMEERGSR